MTWLLVALAAWLTLAVRMYLKDRKEAPVTKTVFMTILSRKGPCSSHELVYEHFEPYTSSLHSGKVERTVDVMAEAHLVGCLRELVRDGYVNEALDGHYSLSEMGLHQLFHSDEDVPQLASVEEPRVRHHQALAKEKFAEILVAAAA